MSIIEVKTFTGATIGDWLNDVTDLRIRVFREWPYLYGGDRSYIVQRLEACARSSYGLFVLAFDGPRVVGASTAMPLSEETYALQQPFRERAIATEDVFYLGESALLTDYRGLGLGHRFFDERERHARRIGQYTMSAFCAVERALDDPRRPVAHRSNKAFWVRRGYHRQDDMFSDFDWPAGAGNSPERHRVRFWLRALESR